MAFIYEYECSECKFQFEAARKLEDRSKPAACPACLRLKGVRIYLSAPRVNWFPGSSTFDSRAEKLDKMAKEAQAEGFRSKAEIEAAVGQAHERAKQLGIPVERILGGTKAPFEGEIKVAPSDAATHKKLYQNYLDAGLLKQDVRKAASAKKELDSFEATQRKKHAGARKFKVKDRDKDVAAAKSQSKHFQKQV